MSLAIDPHSSESFISGSGLVAVAGAITMLIRDLRHHSSPRLRLSSVAALFFRPGGSQLPLWGL